ncbi:MAG: sodium:proton antiporter [Methanomassiliicoccus sp.]|nr:sodium:proton antiporter [Methanomassiliicoccus sp.]
MSESFLLVTVLLGTLLAYSLVAGRLKGGILTPPMIFLMVGLAVSPLALGVLHFNENRELIIIYAELSLSIALFSDAASVNFKAVRRNRLPVRLLLIGLPLSIFLGLVLALATFTGLSFGEAGLIGAILAPTDAALGQAILHDEHVPERIREALDVESGLNDGGSIPFFALFISLAQEQAGQISLGTWVVFSVEQIGFGILVGALIGFIGAALINRSIDNNWINQRRRPIALIVLALLSFFMADMVGGSGFIAAYVAGLTVAAYRSRITEELVEYAEVEGEALSLGVFFILGLVFVELVPNVTWTIVVYALLSLTLVRMLPVWISLIGAKLRVRDKLFMGWFGPRGLASVVLVIIAIGGYENIPGMLTVVTTGLLTVVLSVFAHGISAAPLVKRTYSSKHDRGRIGASDEGETAK